MGAIIPIAASLVTTPIYLNLIGEARYGVLAIVWLLLGYFGIFDLGLGRATAQRIAALRDKPPAERAQIFWTALSLNFGLGCVGGLLIWPVANYFFDHIFKLEESMNPEMLAAVPMLIIAVPMATLSGVLSGALQGRERFLELNIISVSGTLLFQLLPLACAQQWSVDLGVIIPVALLARLLTLLMLFERCLKHIVIGHQISFKRSQARNLLSFGGWITLTSFVGPMMVMLDRMIIGATTGAKTVTYYTVPFQLGERSTVFSTSLTSALYPRFATAGKHEQERIAIEGVRVLAAVMTPLVAIGILIMKPFLSWWISDDFAHQSAEIGQVILLGFWVNGFAKIPSAQLQAKGRPDLAAKCHLAELLPYFLMLYVGLNNFGILGAAVAFSARVIVDFILLARLAGIIRPTLRILLLPAVLLLLALALALQTNLERTAWLTISGTHLCITLLLAYHLSPSIRRDKKQKIA